MARRPLTATAENRSRLAGTANDDAVYPHVTLQDAFYRLEDMGLDLPKFGRGWKANPQLAASQQEIVDFVARNQREAFGPNAAECAINVEAGRIVLAALESRA